jgi:hypothetical protein
MNCRSIKTLKGMVRSILEDIPATRDSDIRLTIEIWKRFYPERTIGGECVAIRLSELYDLPREDNVKRVRAQFQNVEKLYMPTDILIAKKRGILEDEWRVAMGYPTKNTSGTDTPNWTPPSEKKTDYF